MNEALKDNACATLVRLALPYLDEPYQPAVFLWTNIKGTGAPDMGLWQIALRRVPLEEAVAA